MVLANAASAVDSQEDDLFPPSPRVIYEHAPLTQVICQLRFPRLLRIESGPPADFQERIRDFFPLLERIQPQMPELPPEVARIMGIAISSAQSEYAFRREDGSATLSLGPEHISLNTTKYSCWEEFSLWFRPALEALVELYRPSFFQRIGLRYVNLIDRSALGIANRNWSELLQGPILGELQVPIFEEHVTDAKRNVRVNLPNDPGCAMFLQHGFALKKDVEEVLYRLDFDFYRSEKTEVADAQPTLDRLNSMVGRAFRWCITESLHERLGPAPVGLAKPG